MYTRFARTKSPSKQRNNLVLVEMSQGRYYTGDINNNHTPRLHKYCLLLLLIQANVVLLALDIAWFLSFYWRFIGFIFSQRTMGTSCISITRSDHIIIAKIITNQINYPFEKATRDLQNNTLGIQFSLRKIIWKKYV